MFIDGSGDVELDHGGKMRKRIAELEAALKEARENIEHWGAYVSEYFREKHGLQDDLNAIDAVLVNQAGIEANSAASLD